MNNSNVNQNNQVCLLKDEQKATFIELINLLSEDVHKNAINKGWWDRPCNQAELIALAHSELSEALEALRVGNPPCDKLPEFNQVETELADVVIRIMDMCNALGYRLGEAIVAKNDFNKRRQRMHGNKLF